METKQIIKEALRQAMRGLSNEEVPIVVEQPTSESHGDYSTNIAMILAKKVGRNPVELAEDIAKQLRVKSSELRVEKIEVVKPGFINFWLNKEELLSNLASQGETLEAQIASSLAGKKI